MEEKVPASDACAGDEHNTARASRFHFKSGSKSRSKRHTDDRRGEAGESSSRRHRSDKYDESHRCHRKSRRRHRSNRQSSEQTQPSTSTLSGEYYNPDHRYRESLYDHLDNKEVEYPVQDDEEAFRESLFDALADDEGAAYWEGVYGQPVHIYPDTRPGPQGELERMSEEEYAKYVRAKMWEKTHQHVFAEREARDEARRKTKERQKHAEENVAQEEAEREQIRSRMAESLRWGEERRKAKDAEAAWDNYMKRWEALKNASNVTEENDLNIRDLIPWPVPSSEAKHVSTESIERFLRASHTREADFFAMLKVERVRWHPDKMQQRFGQHVDTSTMKLVTAVFQVLDRLWNDGRPAK